MVTAAGDVLVALKLTIPRDLVKAEETQLDSPYEK